MNRQLQLFFIYFFVNNVIKIALAQNQINLIIFRCVSGAHHFENWLTIYVLFELKANSIIVKIKLIFRGNEKKKIPKQKLF